MSTTVTSQPQYSNFNYTESVIDSAYPPPAAAAYMDPQLMQPMGVTSATSLDVLAPLQEVYLKHDLIYKSSPTYNPEFWPSEYYLMSPMGQLILLGKDENPRMNGNFARTRFMSTAGHEVMTCELVTTIINPCSSALQVKPVMTLTSQGQDIGKINQRVQGRCGNVDVLYEDEYNRESAWSFTAISGAIALKGGYQIMENGIATGSILPIIYETLAGKGGRSLVNFKINFPLAMTDGRQKAAIIAAIVRLDRAFFCSFNLRMWGRRKVIRLFGGNGTVTPY